VTSDHLAIAAIQIVLTYTMLPGLLVAALVGSLVPAAVINALIHFGLCFLALRFLPRLKEKAVHD
jgi:hypothetical protein